MKNPNRVLVSEDTALWQGIFSRLLAQRHFSVFQARDLNETLRALDRYFFNTVIVDLALDPKDESRLDGIETLRHISSQQEGTQAIVLTGKGTVNLAVTTLREFDVYHFLEKEKFDETAFMRILEEANEKAFRSTAGSTLARAPEHLLQYVKWQTFASTLKLPLEDLRAVFTALLREAMPITIRGTQLEVALDDARRSIGAEFWSKWHGTGIRLVAGNCDHVSTIQTGNAIDTRNLDDTCALVLDTHDAYETYAPTVA